MKRFIVSVLLVLLLVATIFFSLFARLDNYNADPTLEPVICEVVELTVTPILEGE